MEFYLCSIFISPGCFYIFFIFHIFTHSNFSLHFEVCSTNFLPLKLLNILYVTQISLYVTLISLLIKSPPTLLDKPNSFSFPSLSSHFLHYFFVLLTVSSLRTETLSLHCYCFLSVWNDLAYIVDIQRLFYRSGKWFVAKLVAYNGCCFFFNPMCN